MLSLRNKTYFVIFSLSLAFFTFAYGMVWYVTERDMRTMQESEAKSNTELVERILNREIENLVTKETDWAQWDDTYQFISDKNEAYITSNLNDESLRSLGIDVMVFVNNSGELVYAKQIFSDGSSEVSLPHSLETYINQRGELLKFSESDRVKKGLLTTTDATFLIATQPITTSDGRGVQRGVLIFARYLTDEYNGLLSSLSGFSVKIAPYDTRLSSDQKDILDLSVAKPFQTIYRDDKIQSFKLVKNIFGNPSLLLQVEHTASIIEAGRSFLWRNLWYAVFALVTFVGILMIAIDFSLIRRIENMRRIAHKVAVMQAGTLPEGDIDDFSYLATVMISALKKVGQSDSIALGNRNEMEKFKMVIDQSLDHIIITDPEGKVLYANKAAEKMTGYSLEEMLGNTPGLWGKQMSSEFYRQLWDTIRLRKEVFEGEVTNKRKDGARYRAFARITPILDEKRRVLYFIGNEHPLGRD